MGASKALVGGGIVRLRVQDFWFRASSQLRASGVSQLRLFGSMEGFGLQGPVELVLGVFVTQEEGERFMDMSLYLEHSCIAKLSSKARAPKASTLSVKQVVFSAWIWSRVA